MTKTAKHERRKPSTGPVQAPLDGELAKWLDRKLDADVQSIEAYPLWKKRDREHRCYEHKMEANPKLGTERAVELANEIVSDCQLHCDKLNTGEKAYQVALVNNRTGGLADPLVHVIALWPRVHHPAPAVKKDDDEPDDNDGDALTARKLMLKSVKLIHKRERDEQEREGHIVGDVMLMLKGSLQDRDQALMRREQSVDLLIAKNIDLMDKFGKTLEQLAQRHVEERAVGIDEKNADEDRKDRQAAREREGIWSDVTRAGMLEAINVLGKLFPGFGQLFLARLSGKPLPPPPALGQAAPTAPAQPQLPAANEERMLVKRFTEAAEAHKVDADHTAAERLFGKDNATGKPVEAGVFTRAQVAILAGVSAGTLNVDALDALLADSGKPEACTGVQMATAIAYCTPAMLQDVTRFMHLRQAARQAHQPN